MKKIFLLTSLAVVAFASCTKTNNNTTVIAPLPAFTVNGIHDVQIINGNNTYYGYTELPLTVAYSDSAQETVTISLSGLPPGITMDTTWVTSGIPTYNTTISLYDTTQAGATPGTYAMTLTATGATTGKKTYPFNVKILPEPSCTAGYMGKYSRCSTNCSSGGNFTDSVYADPTVPNKIWFTNFDNTGSRVYGIYNCSSGELTIPSQTAGGVYYSTGSGGLGISGGARYMEVSIFNGTDNCTIQMYQ